VSQNESIYLAAAMGGEHQWSGRSLEQIHMGMNITHEDYDRYAQLYYEAARRDGQTKENAEAIRSTINSFRNQIVNK
jgi:hypothetical protein